MKRSRKLIGAAAFSAALAGGGVAGAVLGAPGISGAQDTTSTTVAASTPANAAAKSHPAARRAVHEMRLDRRQGLDAAAKVLGMTPQALRTELRSGKSIADVAKEKGVDVQKVIDAIVAQAKARLETEITKLPDQVTKIVNHKGVPAAPASTTAPTTSTTPTRLAPLGR